MHILRNIEPISKSKWFNDHSKGKTKKCLFLTAGDFRELYFRNFFHVFKNRQKRRFFYFVIYHLKAVGTLDFVNQVAEVPAQSNIALMYAVTVDLNARLMSGLLNEESDVPVWIVGVQTLDGHSIPLRLIVNGGLDYHCYFLIMEKI